MFKLLTVKDVCDLFQISRSTLTRLRLSTAGVAHINHYGIEPPFPPPNITVGNIKWFVESVTAWAELTSQMQKVERARLQQMADSDERRRRHE